MRHLEAFMALDRHRHRGIPSHFSGYFLSLWWRKRRDEEEEDEELARPRPAEPTEPAELSEPVLLTKPASSGDIEDERESVSAHTLREIYVDEIDRHRQSRASR